MTACAAYRASDEKRVLPSHDVCQSQDSCGFQEAWATKSGTGSLLRDPSPNNACTIALAPVPSVSPRNCVQSHFHPILCLPMVIPVQLSGKLLFHAVLCLTAFSARPFCSACRPWQASSHGTASVLSGKTQKFLGSSLSLSYPARHTNSLDSLSLSYAAQLHGPHCDCQDTRIPTSQQPPCIGTLQSQVT